MNVDFPLTLEALILFKWNDEQGLERTFSLIDKVSARWRDFGHRLGLSENLLQAMEVQYLGDASKCWTAVMDKWLSGEGVDKYYPVTWKGLYSLLNYVGFEEVTKSLKKAVSDVSNRK